MKKTLINAGAGLMIIFGLSLFAVSCKKDNNNNNLPALGSAGPLTMLPNSGDAGTLVTITGSGFNPNASDDAVTFNGKAANIVNATETQLIVQAPDGGSTGSVQITVNGKSISAGTYTFQTLSIHSIEPVNGPSGTNVRIIGAGFGSDVSPAAVTINGVSAQVVSVVDTLLIAAVPANAGTGPVVVTVNGETATGPVFTYQAITTLSPTSGGAGTVITLTGTGFSPVAAQNTVTVNGIAVVVNSATATTIVATLQSGVTTGPVSVTINGERTVGPVFTVVPPPAITTLSPNSGPAGVAVTITGTNFSPVAAQNTVTFNGVTAVVSSASSTTLVVNAPANATTGNVAINTNGQVSAGVPFTVQSLGIAKLSPDNGLDGTVVTITGTGFSTTAMQNLVYFNGVQATVSSATATQLVVTVPAGTTTGAVTIKVGNLQAVGPLFTHGGVQTFVGGPNSNVLMSDIHGIGVDANNNLYIANTGNNNILKVTPAGIVSVFAGSPTGASGFTNGNGTQALFNYIDGLVVDGSGNVYVSDVRNNAIRKITQAGDVSTYLALDYNPEYLAINPQGAIYVSQFSNIITQYPAGGGSTRTASTQANNNQFAIDAAGNLYYAGAYNQIMYKVSPALVGSNFAGQYFGGFVDGAYGIGKFNTVSGIAVDPTTQNIIVSDQYNNAIRMVTPAGVISTIAGGGNYSGQYGYQDGTLGSALFNSPESVAVDKNGIIYVVDYNNNAIRKIALK